VITPLVCWPLFVMVKLATLLDDPRTTVPSKTDAVELARLPGVMPAPEALTLPLPPGVAEKVKTADRAPAALGVNTMRTVQLALAASVVVPERQSPVAPAWMANSALFDATVMTPLGC